LELLPPFIADSSIITEEALTSEILETLSAGVVNSQESGSPSEVLLNAAVFKETDSNIVQSHSTLPTSQQSDHDIAQSCISDDEVIAIDIASTSSSPRLEHEVQSSLSPPRRIENVNEDFVTEPVMVTTMDTSSTSIFNASLEGSLYESQSTDSLVRVSRESEDSFMMIQQYYQ
jgi:hypothetical protein